MSQRTKTNDELKRLAKLHGHVFITLHRRHFEKGIALDDPELVKPPARKGKYNPLTWCGKTLKEWREWLKENGVHLDEGTVSGARIRYMNRGMSEEEALRYYLNYQNIPESTVNNLITLKPPNE